MAFDPDAYLSGRSAPAAAPAPRQGFDPDAYLQQASAPGPWRSGFVPREAPGPKLPPLESLPENQPSAPTRAEAAAAGAASGMFAGLGDKVAASAEAYGANPANVSGGVGGIFSAMDAAERRIAAGDPTGTRTAAEAQRVYREGEAAARDAHPLAYYPAQFGGAMVGPGPKGVLRGAAVQATATALDSDADTLEGRLADAAMAGGSALAVGGALKGVGAGTRAVARKVIGEAPARVEARATNALLEGTPARTVQDPAIAKLGGKDQIPKVLKDEGLTKQLFGPASKLDEALEARMDEVGGQLGGIYERVAKVDPGVPPEFVRDRLMALADKHRADPEAAAAIRNYANALRAEFNEQWAMSAQDLHQVTIALGRRGYGTNPANPSMGAQLKREIRNEVRSVLQQHVDDVAKQDPSVGSLAELQALNKRYSRLTAIEDVAAAKAQREERYSPTLGQRAMQVARYGTSAAGALGAAQQLAEGNVGVAAVGALATGMALAAPHVARAADVMAAKVADSRVATWLQTSRTTDELLTRALMVGIPREVALQVIEQGKQQPAPGAPAAPVAPAPMVSGR